MRTECFKESSLSLTVMGAKTTKPCKVLIAAGGTGGHLFPGLAVAEEFRRTLQTRVGFITTPKPVTLNIIEQYDFPKQILDVRTLRGGGKGRRLLALAHLPLSLWRARGILSREKPDLVVGMGGYISGPVGWAARRLKIPLVIHEQNAVLGTTNRMLAGTAAKIFLSFPQTENNPAPEKSVWIGNPVRTEFSLPSSAQREDSPFTVLVMGGSQGAHHLNLAILGALPLLASYKQQMHFIHLTGEADEAMVRAGYKQFWSSATVTAFSPHVMEFMRRAHVVVCRAGASTLAELTVLGRVGILVPYPYAVNQHQRKNADFLSNARAAFLVLNEELTGEKIAAMIEKLILQPLQLTEMEERSRVLGRPQAASLFVGECQKLLNS